MISYNAHLYCIFRSFQMPLLCCMICDQCSTFLARLSTVLRKSQFKNAVLLTINSD